MVARSTHAGGRVYARGAGAGAYTQYLLIDAATLEFERLTHPRSSNAARTRALRSRRTTAGSPIGDTEGFWLYDRKHKEWAKHIAGEQHRSNALAPMRFLPDSKRLIALGDQLQIAVFDVETGTRLGQHDQPFGDFEGAIKVSADGSRVIVYKFLSGHLRGV